MLFFGIGISLLMVSNIKYYSGKDMKIFARKPFMSFFLLVVLLVVIVAIPEVVIFVLMVGYAISGPIWWVAKCGQQIAQKNKEKKKNKQE